MCGKENIFKGYIALELQLGEVDRCRALYAKFIEKTPFSCGAWKAFSQLETDVGETARARYCPCVAFYPHYKRQKTICTMSYVASHLFAAPD